MCQSGSPYFVFTGGGLTHPVIYGKTFVACVNLLKNFQFVEINAFCLFIRVYLRVLLQVKEALLIKLDKYS